MQCGDLTGNDLLQGNHNVRGNVDGVHALFRSGAVAAHALDLQHEAVEGGHAAAGNHYQSAGRDLGIQDGADVAAEHGIHAVHDSLFNGDGGALAQLLSGLEHKADVALELLAVLLEHPQGTQQHGRMGVVAAGMHAALMLGGVGNAGILLNRQRVDVRTQQHRLAGLSALDLANDAGVLLILLIGDAQPVQLGGDIGLGLGQIKAYLGDLVQVPAKRDDVILEFLTFFPHDLIPPI